MCFHIVGLITIYILPRFIRGERTQKASVSVAEPASISTTVTSATSNGIHYGSVSSSVSAAAAKSNDVQTNGMNGHQIEKTMPSNIAHKNDKFVHDDDNVNVPINGMQCDINVNTDIRLGTDNGINRAARNSVNDSKSDEAACNSNSLNNVDNDTNVYRRHISNDNQHLSKKIRERIDSETRNIEEFIDKTVTGFVELKDDLMRVNQDERYNSLTAMEFGNASGNSTTSNGDENGGLRKRNLPEIETFLRKEINNAVNQVNVLPAVLSNGHAD